MVQDTWWPWKRSIHSSSALSSWAMLEMKNETEAQTFTDLAYILFDQSVLSRSDQLENPIHFVTRLNARLSHFS